MNQIVIIGNLTKDPVAGKTATGKEWTNMSVAVNRGDEVDFFDVTAWGQLAINAAKFLKKGSKCSVSGEMRSHKYEDKNGKTCVAWRIIADKIEFLSPKTTEADAKKADEEFEDLNLPF